MSCRLENSTETLAMNRPRKMVYDAEKYIWVLAEQSKSSYTPVANEKVSKEVKLKFIIQ